MKQAYSFCSLDRIEDREERANDAMALMALRKCSGLFARVRAVAPFGRAGDVLHSSARTRRDNLTWGIRIETSTYNKCYLVVI